MEKVIISLVILTGLSFIGMAVEAVFDKPRLIDFFYLVCMALGGVALVLCFINMLLIE